MQKTLTYFIRGSITVWLTSYLTGLDLTKPENMFLIQHQQSIWIQSSQIGDQLYSDISPYTSSNPTSMNIYQLERWPNLSSDRPTNNEQKQF